MYLLVKAYAVAREISKRGNRDVRKCLFEAKLSAARFNPRIQAIYRQPTSEGSPDKVARIVAARELLLLAHAICESEDHLRVPTERRVGFRYSI